MQINQSIRHINREEDADQNKAYVQSPSEVQFEVLPQSEIKSSLHDPL